MVCGDMTLSVVKLMFSGVVWTDVVFRVKFF